MLNNNLKKKCSKCQGIYRNKVQIELGDVLIIFVSKLQIGTYIDFDFDNRGKPELTFADIPETITLYKKKYQLAFLSHFVKSINHFVAKVATLTDEHTECDDLEQTSKLISNKHMINPKLLVYILRK